MLQTGTLSHCTLAARKMHMTHTQKSERRRWNYKNIKAQQLLAPPSPVMAPLGERATILNDRLERGLEKRNQPTR